MTRYQCVVQVQGDREMSWHTLRSVVEDSTDPAALARSQLRRVAANRRHTLTMQDLRVSVFDATRPGFERLRRLWAAAAHRQVGRSYKIIFAAPARLLDIIADHAATLLNVACGGEASRAEIRAARDVSDQIKTVLKGPPRDLLRRI